MRVGGVFNILKRIQGSSAVPFLTIEKTMDTAVRTVNSVAVTYQVTLQIANIISKIRLQIN